MASFNMSKFNSQINRLKQQTRRAENEMNRAINKCNRDMRNAFNKYNASVRQYNSNVRRNKQIISNELRKLNSSPSVSTSYTISSRNMQTYYDEINAFYSEGIEVTPKQNHILDLVEQEQASSLVTENYIESGSTAIIRLDSFMPDEEAWKNYYKHEIRLRKFAIHELKTVYSQMKKNWKRESLADRIAFLELEVDACKAEIKSVDDEITARLARLDKIGQK